MQIPVEITFRDMPRWDAVEKEILARAERLERFYDKITSCRVVVEAPHLHHQKGQLYNVRIDMTVPGREIVVNRVPHENHAREEIQVAIRDAFKAAQRQLQDYVRERRGQVKAHEPTPHGRVLRLFPHEGYGFLETPDGRELYFHRNSVLDDGYDALEVGTEIRFVEEAGEKGPQATSVRAVGRHGHVE